MKVLYTCPTLDHADPLMLGFLKNFRIKETSYFGVFENFQRSKAFHEMICKNWWFRIRSFDPVLKQI
jgi:hypothetical protein